MKKLLLQFGMVLLPITVSFGQTWTAQNSGTNTDLWGVSFVDPVNGWVSGASGIILHTSDGGTTWSAQTSGVSTPILRTINFYDINNGWTIGDNGTILHTSNGGTTWSPQTSGVSVTLRQTSFVSTTLGWACGASGTILHTTDGGTTWTPQTSGTTIGLMSIHFVDANNGWAVGSSGGTAQGIILHTSDGGANWAPQTAPNNSNLNACYFQDANTGWAAGNTGAIFNTIDGGANWTAQTNPSSNNIRGTHFVNATDGWCVGDAGSIVNTTDGGTTWNTQTSNTTQIFRATHFVNSTRGYAVAVAGTIQFYNLPSISDNATLTPFATLVGTPSVPQSFTVSGMNLTANIDITAPADFEVSLSAVSGFGPMVSLSPTNTVLASTTIYVRYNPAASGTSSGTVDLSSTGATTLSIPVSGTAGNAGIEENSSTDMQLYPNPTSGELNILLNNDISTTQQVVILDCSGRTVYTENKVPTNNLITIYTDLKPGTYLLQLNRNSSGTVKRFIVK